MYYIFSKLPKAIDFVNGSVQAFRQGALFGNEPLRFHKNLYCDDIDFGLRVKEKGINILLSPEVKIIHMKYHSILSLIKNDFRVLSEFAQIILKHKSLLQSARKKRFAHTSLRQVLAVTIAPLVAVIIVISLLRIYSALCNITFGLVLLYVILNTTLLKNNIFLFFPLRKF